MQQGLRSELWAGLYQNLTISKDRPAFFEGIAQAKSSVSLEYKAFCYVRKFLMHHKDKSINKSIESSISSNNHPNSKDTFTHGNFQGQF